MELEKLKYPIGHFESPAQITLEVVNKWIGQIEELPTQLSAVVENLSEAQLNTPYRDGG